MSTMVSSSSSRNVSSNRSSLFGILGDFPGDDELLQRVEEFRRKAAASAASPPPAAEPSNTRPYSYSLLIPDLVSLLESLPHKGRIALVQTCLATSPHRDSILRDLFDYCFEESPSSSSNTETTTQEEEEGEDDNDEFVLIANPSSMIASATSTSSTTADSSSATTTTTTTSPPRPLNLTRFHVFHVVIILMAQHSNKAVGADLSLQYLTQTASTRYRAKILIQCITCFDDENEFIISTDQLWDQYQASSSSVQEKMIEACQKSGKRKDLLRRIYEQQQQEHQQVDDPRRRRRHDDLIYWLDAEYVSTKIDALLWDNDDDERKNNNEEKSSSKQQQQQQRFKLKRWGALGDVYIASLRRQMDKSKHDQLQLGAIIWHQFRNRMELNSVTSSHVKELMELLQNDYKAYHIVEYGRLGQGPYQYLLEKSSRGHDISSFDGVVAWIHNCDADLLRKLTKQERLELALNYIQARDWTKFQTLKDLQIPRHKLPYREFYAAALPGDVFSSDASSPHHHSDASPRHHRKLPYREFNVGARAGDVFSDASCPFLTYFCDTNELLRGTFHGSKERFDIVQAWTGLHLRCTPTKLSEVQRVGHTSANLWSTWYTRYAKVIRASPSFFVKMEQDAKSAQIEPYSRARLEKYATYVQGLLQVAVCGMNEVSPHLDIPTTVDPVRELLRFSLYKALDKVPSSSSLEKTHSLVHEGVKIITTLLLPKLDSMMQFDPKVESIAYINQDSIMYFESVMADLRVFWSCFSDQVAQSAASTLLQVSVRADSRPKGDTGFAVVMTTIADPSSQQGHVKRCKFAHFNFALHAQAKKACSRLAQQLLLDLRTSSISLDTSLLKQLWGLVGDSLSLQEPVHLSTYLDAFEKYLPICLQQEEKPLMMERSRAFINEKVSRFPARWKDYVVNVVNQLARLDQLESVLDHDDISSEVRIAILTEHGGFGNELAQQSLKEATFTANGEARADGISNWLAAAYETRSPVLISEALSFAAFRLKNEPGVHRKTVFAELERLFVSKVVETSLQDECGCSLKVHQKLCSAIVTIQKNDSSRLDSVGRYVCFPRLPRLILEHVLRFDPSRPSLERRQMWANCVMQMHWEFQKDRGGEESLHSYKWPVERPRELESARWVPLEAFEAVYPPSKPSSITKIGLLKQHVMLRDYLYNDFDHDKVFGPTQCVEMLEKAIDLVWNESLPTCALRMDGHFPKEIEVADALRSRLQTLFSFCGTAWQEVEFLTTVFDKIFSNFDVSSVEHYTQASKLLDFLFELHHEDAFPVPRLAKACNLMFRKAERLEDIHHWLGRWQMVYLERGSRAWDFPVDSRLENFLLKHGRGCEPECWRLVLQTQSDQIERECKMARELLGMSPSALLIDEVRTILFERRQDVVLRCVNDVDSLQGRFHFSDDDHDTLDELLFFTLKSKWLLSCHSEVSHRYAKFAQTEASNSQRDLQAKVVAISSFMNAPSTQHDDVSAALQSNLEDAVREALINRVFDLDSPWHILGFLLSQKAIAKNDQRVTSALLGYVAQHVHVDKVVRVVGILLESPRRNKLSIQLHKSVIRMLFDANTQQAKQLLRAEWNNELHNSVRSLIVDKCIHLVAEGTTEDWEASVLSQVATSSSYELELKFCLFAPHCPGVYLSITNPDGVATDELFEHFQQKGPSFFECENLQAVNKFRSIMQELENSSEGTLQFLAKLQKLALSPLFLPTPLLTNEGQLEDLFGYLTDLIQSCTAMTPIDHKTQVGMNFVSILFSKGACKLLLDALTRNLLENTSDDNNFINLCNNNAAALQLRECVQSLLNATLDLPIRNQSQRSLILKSLETIMLTVQSIFSRSNVHSNMHKVLIVKPFLYELSILQQDASLVNGALGSHYGHQFGRGGGGGGHVYGDGDGDY